MNDPVTLLGFIHTSPFEIASFFLAVTMVFCNIRQSPWGWFFSISSCVLYSFVFYESKLYGDMGLQFFFISVSLWGRSEEHTSELQSLMRISYAVFCLKKKNKKNN